MRHAWLLVVASIAAAPVTAEEKAQPLPPGRPALSDARATALLDRLGADLSEPEAVELRSLRRGDPSRDVRLAAAWVLGHRQGGSAEPDDPSEVLPRIVHSAPPRYPPDARRDRVQGTVLVEFLIDDEGRVAYAEARESIPPLDAEAIATVKRWRFRPARVADKPVVAVAQAPVRFRLR